MRFFDAGQNVFINLDAIAVLESGPWRQGPTTVVTTVQGFKFEIECPVTTVIKFLRPEIYKVE